MDVIDGEYVATKKSTGEKVVYRGGKWVPYTPKPMFPSAGAHMRSPEEMAALAKPSGIVGALKRNVPPILAQTGGEELGGLAGLAAANLLAPELAVPLELGGAALGAGGANVLATRTLPEEYGGTPEESNKAAFLWGAVPALIGRGATRGLEAYGAKRTAEATAREQEAFEKEAARQAGELQPRIGEALKPRVTSQDIGLIRQGAGYQPYSAEVSGPVGQAETFEARDAVLDPINDMRRKLGEPLGDAYKKLKGEGRISEQEALDIADAAQGVRDDLVAPYPKARDIFEKIKRWRPEPPSQPPQGATPLGGGLFQMPSGRGYWQAPHDLTMDEMRAQNMTDRQIEEEMARQEARKPPSVDQLRELRQVVNGRLQSAEGGDIHALLDLQQAIDRQLMPRLPADIQAMRADYAHFMNNYPWRQIRGLRRAGTPQQVADWFYRVKGPQANEIIAGASPEQRAVYQRMYASRLFRGVNDADSPIKQMAQLNKNARQDIQSGLVQNLYGKGAADQIAKLTRYPMRADAASKVWGMPAVKRQWADSFLNAAKSAKVIDRQAAEDAFQDLLNSLPPEERAQLQGGMMRGLPAPAQPVLLQGPREALKGEIVKGANAPMKLPFGRLAWAGPFALGSLLMGKKFGVTYGVGTGMLLGAGLGAKTTYRWAINHGVADVMSDAYAAMARGEFNRGAKMMFRAMVIAGGRVAHEETRDDAINQ